MPASPLTGSEGALFIGVKSNGEPIPDAVAVLQVHVLASLSHAASARLVIADGDMPESIWPLADGSIFQPGAAISISAGYGDGEAQTLFEGTVTRLGVQIRSDNASRLVVDCRRAVSADTPAPQQDARAVLKVSWGEDLLDFAAEVSDNGRAGRKSMRGHVKFQGHAAATPGATIELVGVGVRCGGDVLIGAVEHEIADGNWITTVEFGPEAKAPLDL